MYYVMMMNNAKPKPTESFTLGTAQNRKQKKKNEKKRCFRFQHQYFSYTLKSILWTYIVLMCARCSSLAHSFGTCVQFCCSCCCCYCCCWSLSMVLLKRMLRSNHLFCFSIVIVQRSYIINEFGYLFSRLIHNQLVIVRIHLFYRKMYAMCGWRCMRYACCGGRDVQAIDAHRWLRKHTEWQYGYWCIRFKRITFNDIFIQRSVIINFFSKEKFNEISYHIFCGYDCGNEAAMHHIAYEMFPFFFFLNLMISARIFHWTVWTLHLCIKSLGHINVGRHSLCEYTTK